ncbi:hypothetical protein LSAT2_026850 [Lamellibrachia satsuma]|nr:hypothetical protein LSAT2_026850 [Lamellibrachia satsuma]
MLRLQHRFYTYLTRRSMVMANDVDYHVTENNLNDANDVTDSEPKLIRVTTEGGRNHFAEEKTGRITMAHFEQHMTCIYDNARECFVWVSQRAATEEKRLGLEYAHVSHPVALSFFNVHIRSAQRCLNLYRRNGCVSAAILRATVAVLNTPVMSVSHLYRGLPLLLSPPLFPPVSSFSIHFASWCGQHMLRFWQLAKLHKFCSMLQHAHAVFRVCYPVALVGTYNTLVQCGVPGMLSSRSSGNIQYVGKVRCSGYAIQSL